MLWFNECVLRNVTVHRAYFEANKKIDHQAKHRIVIRPSDAILFYLKQTIENGPEVTENVKSPKLLWQFTITYIMWTLCTQYKHNHNNVCVCCSTLHKERFPRRWRYNQVGNVSRSNLVHHSRPSSAAAQCVSNYWYNIL